MSARKWFWFFSCKHGYEFGLKISGAMGMALKTQATHPLSTNFNGLHPDTIYIYIIYIYMYMTRYSQQWSPGDMPHWIMSMCPQRALEAINKGPPAACASCQCLQAGWMGLAGGHSCMTAYDRQLHRSSLSSWWPWRHTCCRADSRLASSQWEKALQSNAISHWLDANLESAWYWKFFLIVHSHWHWGLNKMAAILQTTFSNAFSFMEMIVFWLQFDLRLQLQ